MGCPLSMTRRAIKAICPTSSKMVSKRLGFFSQSLRTSLTDCFVGAAMPVSPMTMVNGAPTLTVSTSPLSPLLEGEGEE